MPSYMAYILITFTYVRLFSPRVSDSSINNVIDKIIDKCQQAHITEILRRYR